MLYLLSAPPAPPTHLAVKDTEQNSVTIAWQHPKYFEIDYYHIRIWQTSSNTWQNASRVHGKYMEATLSDLEADIFYNVTMYSENKYGVGLQKSKVLQVKTIKGM